MKPKSEAVGSRVCKLKKKNGVKEATKETMLKQCRRQLALLVKDRHINCSRNLLFQKVRLIKIAELEATREEVDQKKREPVKI